MTQTQDPTTTTTPIVGTGQTQDQHLEALELSGLVARAQGVAAGRGRPPA